MKLRNKQTGEVVELLAKPSFVKRNEDFLQSEVNTFNSLAELNAEWEDVPEEPKEFWCVEGSGYISSFFIDRIKEAGYSKDIEDYKEIGNYFESKEEAEKAVERLRAWKRLKEDLVSLHWQDEKDGKFSVWGQFNGNMLANDAILNIHREDLDLLFSGGEE